MKDVCRISYMSLKLQTSNSSTDLGVGILKRAGNNILWNPNLGLEITKPHSSIRSEAKGGKDLPGTISAVTLLAHELSHKWLLKYNTKLYNELKYSKTSIDADENYFILPIERKFAEVRGETGRRFSYNSIEGENGVSVIKLNGNNHRTKVDKIIFKPW